MTAIVLGFESHDRTADPHTLYVGRDKNAAREALEKGAPGIIRTEMYVNPQHHQRRSFPAAPQVVSAPAPVQEPAPQPTETEDPASEEPAALKLPKKGK